MKLIHCADLHLDAKMTAVLPPEKAKERRNELLQTFLRMVDFAQRERVSAILIAGDLFDRNRISAKAGNAVLDAIRSHPDIVFFYVTGNHEGDGFIGSIDSVPANLMLFGSSWKTYEAGKISITGADLAEGSRDELFRSLELDPLQFNIVLLQ
ncbi:MAG: metallophosphoesterase, partial [Eubacterium sp.]|nr:metallophosphoesterase [Eubacterium sp.]